MKFSWFLMGQFYFWKDAPLSKKVKYSHKAVFMVTLSHVDALVKHYKQFIQAENIDNYLGNVCFVLEITLAQNAHPVTLNWATLFSHTNGCPIIHYSYIRGRNAMFWKNNY